MQKWLFLDDTEARHVEFARITYAMPHVKVAHVRTISDALSQLRNNKFDVVWLDHDLDETEADPDENGQVVARYIAWHQEEDLRPRCVVVHSINPEGAKAMAHILRDSGGMDVVLKPFLR